MTRLESHDSTRTHERLQNTAGRIDKNIKGEALLLHEGSRVARKVAPRLVSLAPKLQGVGAYELALVRDSAV